MKELVGIAEQVAAKLIARKETIAVAESSTGGLISASLPRGARRLGLLPRWRRWSTPATPGAC